LPEVKTNSFFSNSLLIFLVRFFPLLATTLILIFFSRQLDTAVYGAYQNFWTQLFVLNSIACLGIHVVIITYPLSFIAAIFKQLRIKHYLSFTVWLLLISSVYACMRHSATGILWLIPQCFLIVSCISLITEAILITARKFVLLIGGNVVYAVIFSILHWRFLKHNIGLNELFTYLLIFIAAKLFVTGTVAYIQIRKQQVIGDDRHSLSKVRSLWMHMGFYDVSQMTFKWMDKAIISVLLTEQLSAIYFNGAVDVPFLSLILGAAGSAVLIQLAHAKLNDTKEHAVYLANYSARILSAIVFPLFFFFLFFSKELFVVIFSEKYLPSVPIFLVSILTMPLFAYHLTAILQNRHKGAVINKGAVLDLLIALALMYPLYQILGLPGVALSCVISSYIQAGFYLYHTGKELGVSVLKLIPLANWTIKLIVFACLFIGIHYVLSLHFKQQFVLFLGLGCVLITALIALWIELNASKRKYG
jgi:O-antigen/teichoic acid export membrane protein